MYHLHPSAGTKPGKHARDASEEGEGSDDAPLPKKSPKSSKTSSASTKSDRKSSKSKSGSRPGTSPSHRPTQILAESDTGQEGTGVSRAGPGSGSGSEKENIQRTPSPERAKKEGVGLREEGIEVETIVPSHLTPVKMEPRELEPLSPLVINDNQDVTMRHHPRATSTPATANGRISSPPLSEYLLFALICLSVLSVS